MPLNLETAVVLTGPWVGVAAVFALSCAVALFVCGLHLHGKWRALAWITAAVYAVRAELIVWTDATTTGSIMTLGWVAVVAAYAALDLRRRKGLPA